MDSEEYKAGQKAERAALREFCEQWLSKLAAVQTPTGGMYEQAMVSGKAATEETFRKMIEWLDKRNAGDEA